MRRKINAIAALLIAAAVCAQAQTYTWDGGADDGTAVNARWNVDDNWVGNTRPTYGTTTDILFHTAGAGNLTSYLGATANIRSLTFNDNVTDTLGIVTENHLGTTRAFTFEADSGAASINVDSGATAGITISGGGDMILGSALNVTHNGSGLLTLGARITGSNGITFAGNGTTRLGAANTFTGDVNLNGGTVQFEAGGRFGNDNNNLIFDGGRIQLVDATTAINIGADRDMTLNDGGGTIDVQTDRILIVPGLLSGTGDLTVTGLGDGSARIRLDNEENRLNWSGDLNIQDGGQVDFNSRDALMNINSTINLDDGTLRMTASGVENIHPNTTIAVGENGGTLIASNPDGEITVRGSITGTGLLTTGANPNDGLVNLVNLVENTSSGGMRVAGGTTRIDAMGQVGSGDITLAGGTLEDSRADGVITGTARTVTIASNSTIRVTGTGDANHRINSVLAGSGDLTVAGGGTVTPSNTDNTFSGSWSVTEGSTVSVATAADGSNVRLGSGSNLDLDNGTLNFSGSAGGVENTHTRDTVLGAGGGTFELGNASGQNPTITWNGAISGEGALTVANKGGTTAANKLILGGANTFSGDTVIDSGSTLELAESGQLMFYIALDGVNNRMTGGGTANLDGSFVFDLSSASTTVDDSWIIVTDTLSETYGQTFSVDGFADAGGGLWTKDIGDGSSWYEFDQGVGTLTVIPEPAALGMLLAGLAGLLGFRRMFNR